MRTVNWIVAGIAAVFLVAVLYSSMSWRVELDAPILLYQAYLMDEHGFVPYRDLFDMNMPGTYLAFFTIGKVFGYGGLGIRMADGLLVATMSGATAAMWWRLSRPAAVLAGSLVALCYLSYGQYMTLQREFLLVVVIALGVAAATSTWPIVRRSLLAGLAFGVAATIKPHALVGLLPLVAYLASEAGQEPEEPRRKLLLGLAAGTAGVALPLLVAFGWMLAMGIVDDFRHSIRYLPYYGSLSGRHVAVLPDERPAFLLRGLQRLGGQPVLWEAAWVSLAWGVFAAALTRAQQRILLLFGGMLLVFTIYPAFSGQFWKYHWFPMSFWMMAAYPALLLPQPEGSGLVRRGLPRVAALGLLYLLLRGDEGLEENHYFQLARPPLRGRPDAIAAILKEHVDDGDTVQGVGWAGDGITHGMLLAEVELATKYVYAFHFYHHVSSRYIRRLRRDFLARFDGARPDFVVVAKPVRPWVHGVDTTTRFPGLERRLRKRYVVIEDALRYAVLERADRRPAP